MEDFSVLLGQSTRLIHLEFPCLCNVKAKTWSKAEIGSLAWRRSGVPSYSATPCTLIPQSVALETLTLWAQAVCRTRSEL